MDGLIAYVLAKKMIGQVETGLKDITLSNGELQFELANGETKTVPMPGGCVFTSKEDLPPEGNSDTLYMVDGQLMYWSGTEYVAITNDNSLKWESIPE